MHVLRSTVLAISVTAGALFASSSARAHDMNATVKVEPTSVRVEVFFEDDLPAELAKVIVTSSAGAEVVTGTTDDRGVWTFPTPVPGEYTLTAKCIGHTTTVQFSVAGSPEAPPVSYTGERLNKTVGLTIGVGGLLGVSAVFWLLRRRHRE
ncbi:Uncharacterized protein OS=Thermovibrio ammonificans (strain DSM 15698 / JCM 12110 / HB-1) GN=Theam_1524 PE=4 SV=1: CarboxypepD_reg [Gemmata massiliana]|uniref:Carboxypeptidase regulatory-like domain-containing protein n=2 Tax=Gemmata massiliana TaxID=1210884 RepID=A0A6P2CPE5_9BACT|nr:Uncharacterized protein OS=Thermovibrio ammonificans (strain DSM 15698 / JCM 12110 / HB-1) GN=Theam_1524 PE=4 SV=1: CarboxypepD_reg [Gemmata massiliana]